MPAGSFGLSSRGLQRKTPALGGRHLNAQFVTLRIRRKYKFPEIPQVAANATEMLSTAILQKPSHSESGAAVKVPGVQARDDYYGQQEGATYTPSEPDQPAPARCRRARPRTRRSACPQRRCRWSIGHRRRRAGERHHRCVAPVQQIGWQQKTGILLMPTAGRR